MPILDKFTVQNMRGLGKATISVSPLLVCGNLSPATTTVYADDEEKGEKEA